MKTTRIGKALKKWEFLDKQERQVVQEEAAAREWLASQTINQSDDELLQKPKE
jgi:hypothetical protein